MTQVSINDDLDLGLAGIDSDDDSTEVSGTEAPTEVIAVPGGPASGPASGRNCG